MQPRRAAGTQRVHGGRIRRGKKKKAQRGHGSGPAEGKATPFRQPEQPRRNQQQSHKDQRPEIGKQSARRRHNGAENALHRCKPLIDRCAHSVARRKRAERKARDQQQHGQQQGKHPGPSPAPAPRSCLYGLPLPQSGAATAQERKTQQQRGELQTQKRAGVVSAAKRDAQQRTPADPERMHPSKAQPQHGGKVEEHCRVEKQIEAAAVEPVDPLREAWHALDGKQQEHGGHDSPVVPVASQQIVHQHTAERRAPGNQRAEDEKGREKIPLLTENPRVQRKQSHRRIGPLPVLIGVLDLAHSVFEHLDQRAGLDPSVVRVQAIGKIVHRRIAVKRQRKQRHEAQKQYRQQNSAENFFAGI